LRKMLIYWPQHLFWVDSMFWLLSRLLFPDNDQMSYLQLAELMFSCLLTKKLNQARLYLLCFCLNTEHYFPEMTLRPSLLSNKYILSFISNQTRGKHVANQ
jgi:hypothetical protein